MPRGKNKNRKKTGFKKILVPVDFSPHSNLALRYACLLARQFNATLSVVHVVDSLAYSVTDTLNVVEHRRALETLSTTLLDNLRSELEEQGLAVKTRVIVGTPYRAILDQAERGRIDLIVMGTHGRTGVEHLLLGSVAERVVRLSPCPVLTTRAPASEPAARKGMRS